MQGLMRLVQSLAMAIWVGGLVFFAFVLAPTAFHTLPTIHEAGLIVGATLRVFDVLALICGVVFLAATATMFRMDAPRIRGRHELEFLLAGLMVFATAYIHWGILPAMEDDRRLAGGDVALAAPNDPARVHFDQLHLRSERVEGLVLVLGFGVLFLMSQERTVVPQAQ